MGMDAHALVVIVCLYVSSCLSCDLEVPRSEQWIGFVPTEANKMLYALKQGECECVKSMLEAGFDANTRMASELADNNEVEDSSSTRFVAWRLDNDPDNYEKTNTMLCHWSWLNSYSYEWGGNVDMKCPTELLKHGARVNDICKGKTTALMFANKVKVVDLLLKSGANATINQKDNNGENALHHRAFTGPPDAERLEVMKILINNGIEIGGKHLLNAAKLPDRCEGVKLLLANGANPNVKDEKGMTPAQYAYDLQDGFRHRDKGHGKKCAKILGGVSLRYKLAAAIAVKRRRAILHGLKIVLTPFMDRN